MHVRYFSLKMVDGSGLWVSGAFENTQHGIEVTTRLLGVAFSAEGNPASGLSPEPTA